MVYHNIYPNVDWIVSVDPHFPDGFKYTWRLLPGARPSDIQYQAQQAQFKLSKDGNSLRIMGNQDTLLDGKLPFFSFNAGPVAGNYVILYGDKVVDKLLRSEEFYTNDFEDIKWYSDSVKFK